MSKITVIGTGNGGQAFAGYLAMLGHEVRLYGRDPERVAGLNRIKDIRLSGKVEGVGRPSLISADLEACLCDAEIIMITTTADAHRELAMRMAPHLENGQIVVLNPGRTLGAVEFRYVLEKVGCSACVAVVEAQSLAFACRAESPGNVRVIGFKQNVPAAALPAVDAATAVQKINEIMGCFIPAKNVLETSLENIGAVFHPLIVVLNSAAIERGQQFLFYNDMTERAARVVEMLDRERLAVGRAFGLTLRSAEEWVSFAYDGIGGEGLCQKMRNNPAYSRIMAPLDICSRYLTEDVPTGIVPMIELGRLAGVETPIMEGVLRMSEALVDRDFVAEGRTLPRLGLGGYSMDNLLARMK